MKNSSKIAEIISNRSPSLLDKSATLRSSFNLSPVKGLTARDEIKNAG